MSNDPTLHVAMLGGAAGTHVIATYGSLNGTFASITGAPAGTTIDYAFNGNCIAITIPPAYVNAAAIGGAQDGTSWDDAYLTLQDALASLSGGPGEISVAEGTCFPDEGDGQTDNERSSTFQLIDGVAIYGGFPADGSATWRIDRDPRTYPCILSGDLLGDDASVDSSDNAYHVVTGSGADATAILDGFTITAGHADGAAGEDSNGGGMLCISGNPTLCQCEFVGNFAAFYGGAAYLRDANPTITNCRFTGNEGQAGGGAFYANTSAPVFTNCAFTGNYANVRGGAAYRSFEGSPDYINCTFHGNWANSLTSPGGAIYSNSGSAFNLINSVIWLNRARASTSSTSASIEGGGAQFTNCLVHNRDLTSTGTGNLDGTDAGNDPLALECGLDNYSEPGATAIDDFDGDLSAQVAIDASDVIETLGSYEVHDSVADSFGTVAQVTRTVVVQDTSPPVITLAGDATVTLYANSSGYTEPGATVADLCDGSVSVVIGGDTVNTSLPGQYVVTYDAIDASGNAAARLTRTVEVLPALPEVYVGQADDFLITNDVGQIGSLDAGDTVTWDPSGQSVAGLTFGTDALTGIQEAVDRAQTGGTVFLGVGTWDDGDEIVIERAVALQGAGARTTILSGGESHRVLSILEDAGEVTLRDLSVALGLAQGNGSNRQGGGNRTFNRGEIQFVTTLDGLQITGGRADGSNFPDNHGGGVLLLNDEATIPVLANCRLTNNFAITGGAMAAPNNVGTFVRDCYFGDNTATGAGGAWYGKGSEELGSGSVDTFERCTLERNASARGGAYYGFNNSVQFRYSTVRGNSSTTDGGAIFILLGEVDLRSSELSGNSSDRFGGALHVEAGSIFAERVTMAGNRCGLAGGAILGASVTLYCSSTVVWGNSDGDPESSEGDSISFADDVSPEDLEFVSSLIAHFDLSSAGIGNLDGTLASNDPLYVAPIDPAAAPTDSGIYAPRFRSPIIDAGSSLRDDLN